MRVIKVTEDIKEQLLADFTNYINGNRFSQNKIKYETTFDIIKEDSEKPVVLFSEKAYIKMVQLIMKNSGEVGWHGTVTRQDNTFLISDIVVYPQTVTGVTVETDEVEYGNWLHMELSDEQINTLRFHGHSHVNFSPTPSGVDTTWYDNILQTLKEDDYYIFMIMNKTGEFWIELYDLKENKIYETKDIVVDVAIESEILSEWFENSKTKLKNKPAVVSTKGKAIYPKPYDWDDYDLYDNYRLNYPRKRGK